MRIVNMSEQTMQAQDELLAKLKDGTAHAFRLCECPQHHNWPNPVTFGPTHNLTGERNAYCPICRQDAMVYSPWWIVDTAAPHTSRLDSKMTRWRAAMEDTIVQLGTARQQQCVIVDLARNYRSKTTCDTIADQAVMVVRQLEDTVKQLRSTLDTVPAAIKQDPEPAPAATLSPASLSNALATIIAEIQALPDMDVDADLWQAKNHKRLCLVYFSDLQKQLADAELRRRLAACNLTCTGTRNYLVIYNELNTPGHPVREHLLTRQQEIRSAGDRSNS